VTLGASVASVRIGVREAAESREQVVGIDGSRRAVRVDGKRPETMAAYALFTPMVVFHPGAMALAAGGGGERRRLLDRLALYMDPASLLDQQSYAKAAKSRQVALGARGAQAADVGPWEELLVRHGLRIAAARSGAASALAGAAARAFERIAGGSRKLRLAYRPGAPLEAEPFRSELMRHRVRDRLRGSATVGVQRDELDLALDERNVRTMVSQGQQRAVVIALRLAEIEIIETCRGVRPILLLDDVSSELDAARTHALLGTLGQAIGQVLLTTTRPDLMQTAELDEGGRRTFRVVGGRVESTGMQHQ
jgi:DNA replication and repair protein RecF